MRRIWVAAQTHSAAMPAALMRARAWWRVAAEKLVEHVTAYPVCTPRIRSVAWHARARQAHHSPAITIRLAPGICAAPHRAHLPSPAHLVLRSLGSSSGPQDILTHPTSLSTVRAGANGSLAYLPARIRSRRTLTEPREFVPWRRTRAHFARTVVPRLPCHPWREMRMSVLCESLALLPGTEQRRCRTLRQASSFAGATEPRDYYVPVPSLARPDLGS